MKRIVATLLGILPLSPSTLLAFDLHEWGTFTTVSGSDGTLLTGLHVEEEKLPPFVYSHAGMEPGKLLHHNPIVFLPQANPAPRPSSNQIEVYLNQTDKKYYPSMPTSDPLMRTKGFPSRAQIANVTVKMETPVIYFYGGTGEKVNVKVGFNGGTISQWYPARTSGDTPNKVEIAEADRHDSLKKAMQEKENCTLVDREVRDFGKSYQGAIEWDLELLEADDAYTFKHNQNPSWIYPKVSNANMVKVGDEYEDYLFYRGIGAIFSVNDADEVQITNQSAESIPFALAFEKTKSGVRYKAISNLKKETTISESAWTTLGRDWRAKVYTAMRQGLIDQGLTAEESNGMVKTWWKSYFEKDGLRVFWVVPPAELEKILPLQVTPQPESSVRVIVGRADILRPAFEEQLIASVGKRSFTQYRSDRFGEAYINRLEALIKEPVFQLITEKELNGQMLNLKGVKGKSAVGTGVHFQKGKDIKHQQFGDLGKWKVLNEEELMIGDLHFKLNRNNGIMTAKIDLEKTPNSKWERYEIQLPRYLN